MLRVAPAAGGTLSWLLLAAPLDGRAIGPGVRYGTTPPGAIGPDSGVAPDLQTGTTYVVTLTVIRLPQGELEVGRREFTP